jgi:hypothetical protein
MMLGTGAMLLWAVVDARAVTPAQKCEAGKNKAVGKLALCIARNAARAAKGSPANRPCRVDFDAAFTKVEAAAAGMCPTTLDAEAIYYRIHVDLEATTGIQNVLDGDTRFVDNGNGTVTDLATGLTWEQKSALDGSANLADPHDADNLYTWSSGTTANGTAYTDFLEKLNDNTGACFAGHCDWRLPSYWELLTIVDLNVSGCNAGSPCIAPALGASKAESYWTSVDPVANLSSVAVVDFSNGKPSFIAKAGASEYARAVRGGV